MLRMYIPYKHYILVDSTGNVRITAERATSALIYNFEYLRPYYRATKIVY